MTKTKSTKRALLTSGLALLLCLSMFVGTTFAWFTDSVSSVNNKIVAGNLDVELEYYNGSKWVAVDSETNVFTNQLWEPGHTEVVYLKVSNLGTLALKYQLGVNIVSEKEGTNVAGDPFKLSDYIKFGVVEGNVNYGTDRDAARAAVTDAKIISAGYAKSSKLYPVGKGTSEEYVALVVYMPEETGNVANYKTGTEAPEINLGINLYATQYDYEKDSFGDDYDATASITVAPGESIATAIANVEDGGIVYLENGVHNLSSGPIVIEGKTVTIIGVGEVLINKNYGNTHIFTITNGADVTFENIKMDGKGNTREGVYVRWNCKVTLKDCSIKNTGGLDIMIDEASDADHGLNTTSIVNLYNTQIEDVAMCASPVTTVAATQDTYVNFNYDKNSTVGAIDVQSINKKPENIKINGISADNIGKTMQLYVKNDAELKAALETIKTNSEYWNKQVIVYLAAGTYSADHVINQYPEWNGVVGAGSTANNYASGVPAGAPGTVITFVGEAATTYGLRAVATPSVTFTGNVTVNGFGNAGTGFTTAVATTTFKNITFDAANSVEDNNKDYIVMYVKAAANNVTFDGCTFQNATHVTLGGNGANGVGMVNFTGCTFNEGGCLSGYVETLTVSDTTVTAAKKGFISNQKAGTITVENCDVTCSEYAFRTQNSGINITVTDSKINVATEVDGVRALVVFRGSGHTATFKDCDLAYGTTTAGTGTGTLKIENYYEVDGVTYVTDGVTGAQTLYLVPADYEGDTVNVAEGTTHIGGYAFAYNSNIDKIVLPSSVTTLNDRAFRDTSASTVVLNEGLKNISYQAFRNATNVKSVVIPSTVTTISKEAFQSSGITTLTIPATVTTLEYGACRDMNELVSVTIEGNVDIPVYAFRACSKLKTVTITGTDVTFGGGSHGMIFTNKENGDGSAITVTVANEEIKARLLAADTAAKDYGGYKIDCEQTTQTGGYYTDTQGNAYAYDDTALKAALKDTNVDTIVLAGNVTVPKTNTDTNGYGATGVSVLNGQTFDGNGNDFGVNAWSTWDSAINITNGTIKNLTVNSGMRGIFINHNGTAGKVYLENVVIDGTVYTISCDQGTNSGLEAKNSTFNGWTSYAATTGDVKFEDCTFGEGQGYAYCRPYAPTEFVDCDFEAGYVIEACADVTFENCTIGGVPLTAANLATLVTSSTVANATVK